MYNYKSSYIRGRLVAILHTKNRELERHGKLLLCKIKNISLNEGDIVGIIGKMVPENIIIKRNI